MLALKDNRAYRRTEPAVEVVLLSLQEIPAQVMAYIFGNRTISPGK